MNRHRLKSFLTTIVVVILLQYNAAWAILRCCHFDEHESLEETLPSSDLHDEQDRHSPSRIDCLSFDYRSEVSVGAASPPQFHRGTAARTLYVNDLFVPE